MAVGGDSLQEASRGASRLPERPRSGLRGLCDRHIRAVQGAGELLLGARMSVHAGEETHGPRAQNTCYWRLLKTRPLLPPRSQLDAPHNMTLGPK